jgi:Lrp/AsnC family transcriptional regulator, leucine-responsive regulatory protein
VSTVDKTDINILSYLETDARQSFAELGERVGLSKTPCWKRVQSLESSGLIKGYRTAVDPKKLGLNLYAFVNVTIDASKYKVFESAVLRHPSILQCFSTAGEADYLMQVLVRDVESRDDLIRLVVAQLPGVQRTVSTVCMKIIKDYSPVTGCL